MAAAGGHIGRAEERARGRDGISIFLKPSAFIPLKNGFPADGSGVAAFVC
jgi:hypothetical protein